MGLSLSDCAFLYCLISGGPPGAFQGPYTSSFPSPDTHQSTPITLIKVLKNRKQIYRTKAEAWRRPFSDKGLLYVVVCSLLFIYSSSCGTQNLVRLHVQIRPDLCIISLFGCCEFVICHVTRSARKPIWSQHHKEQNLKSLKNFEGVISVKENITKKALPQQAWFISSLGVI